MLISILVASAENNVIGFENRLIWRLSDDLKNFKKLTTGHTVLMGRNTFESIGKPLPNRKNIVLSTQNLPAQPDISVFADLPTAIKWAENGGETELFIIGGGKIYAQTLEWVGKLYWTKVHASPEGDTYFFPPPLRDWEMVSSIYHEADEKNEFPYTLEIWERVF